MLEVLSMLSVQDLGRLAQVSKESSSIVDDDCVWRRLCRTLELEWTKVLNKPLSQVPKVQTEDGWKGQFQQGVFFLCSVYRF